jgi:hypothetical protein
VDGENIQLQMIKVFASKGLSMRNVSLTAPQWQFAAYFVSGLESALLMTNSFV